MESTNASGRPKTILWAALSANGNYARSTAAHPPPAEALADFFRETAVHGNFIVGRATFEGFMAQQKGDPEPPRFDLTVLSRSLVLPTSADGRGAAVVPSPRAALERVAALGHRTTVIAGGTSVHSAFLAEGLVDEAVFVINPVFEDEGQKLVLPAGRRDATLLEHVALGGGVVRLRYALGPAGSW